MQVIIDESFNASSIQSLSVSQFGDCLQVMENVIFHLNFTQLLIGQIKSLGHHTYGKHITRTYAFLYIIFSFRYQPALKHQW